MAKFTLMQALEKGIAAHKAGKIEEADRFYTAIMKAQPEHPHANHNMGVLAVGIGQIETALPFFKTALEVNPSITQFWLSYIDALMQLEKFEDAKTALTQAASNGAKGNAFDKLKEKLQASIVVSEKGSSEHEPDQNNILDSLKLDQAIRLASNKIKTGNYDEAKHIYDDILVKYPKNKKAIDGLKKLTEQTISYPKKNQNPSKDQIQELIKFHDDGHPKRALERCEELILQYPKSAILFNIKGVLLKSLGHLDLAIENSNKALEIDPEFAEAYNNIGIILKEKNKLDDALVAFKKAADIRSNFNDAWNNIGVILGDQGNVGQAIDAYTKALAIKPDDVRALKNMSVTLKSAKFNKEHPAAEAAIISILDKKTISRPSDIAQAALSLVKCKHQIKDTLSSDFNIANRNSLEQVIKILSETPLLLKIMSVCPLPDLQIESFLSRLRSQILRQISDININSNFLKVQSALAQQCFTNEYVYSLADTPIEDLKKLENSIAETLTIGNQPEPKFILCLASFQALYKYDWSDQLKFNPDIDEVFKMQILEPRAEHILKSEITRFETITDFVSEKVRDQYEDNPYPRWVNLGLRRKPATLSQVAQEVNLKISNVDILTQNNLEILVAGCGTGRHSIETAARFKNSNVLAIDLSLSSLAYAQRKSNELSMENLSYTHTDILNVGKLARDFDVIESVGVLHHMDDPMLGWQVLVDRLKLGGLMKIGLYSDLARKPVFDYRFEIAEKRLAATESNIRSIREKIATSNDDFSEQIKSWGDFYSMSEIRDLIFHVQEHCFTLPQIKECISKLGLEFCGFETKHIVKNFKLSNSKKGAEYDLSAWHEYEKANPQTFIGMYQFWCQKIS